MKAFLYSHCAFPQYRSSSFAGPALPPSPLFYPPPSCSDILISYAYCRQPSTIHARHSSCKEKSLCADRCREAALACCRGVGHEHEHKGQECRFRRGNRHITPVRGAYYCTSLWLWPVAACGGLWRDTTIRTQTAAYYAGASGLKHQGVQLGRRRSVIAELLVVCRVLPENQPGPGETDSKAGFISAMPSSTYLQGRQTILCIRRVSWACSTEIQLFSATMSGSSLCIVPSFFFNTASPKKLAQLCATNCCHHNMRDFLFGGREPYRNRPRTHRHSTVVHSSPR